ncbi:MAG: UDP-N-acetylglucosamine--N-acetylmuramyl-(pentapeptide) pyrophosphoryl-undecaprenol N-acetylglucosamine transferase [bacterium]|uniref:UDP-N-acetylglucosamine--N-acetylmuramyl-(Pentapeptide) pyrophosphoryl-undecaprenol N-acetylglucosamine transferase n=2 Tax=Bacteria candidate phyla TaxID=1783234 RepID=A0A124G0M2_UNCT6|nr:MAG: UDP-N-acetylglucosamine--N-acetylmuramyl-(pentapeptide) pyrophosphoryl-undecaprenol N-acetylglucosamine transferase [candidate division TA06 bacterium 32_111]KUK87907.1 MAG: UDP-N-acetylglucosamine--N-acetylmuramyl-(pentapeptide) pyrophosphoryl-undecaprenol N-acetylglucosamine transferase [candidate division TA06 bacterium 34_109]MDI6700564.1 UDP-N-acetylglucosamine--N-acetylmuramyl-(pentapeptide) pyrophosphoryl-undecaprenol N-acetylglucosamine transferase [bacterium]HAF08060.1 hypotheti
MNFKKDRMNLIICAGGTGGHIIPAVTLGKNLTEYNVSYICGNREIEKKIYYTYGIKPIVLDIKSFEPLRFILKFPSLLLYSFKILFKIKPKTLILAGNYISFPVGIASIILGKKLLLLEQDAVIGKTNRILSRYAFKIFSGFPLPFKYVDNRKIVHTGHILRENIFEFKEDDKVKLDKSKKTILIFGGSQGAKNVAQKIIDFLYPVKGKFNIILVAGNHYEDFKDYDGINILPFYENMGFLYSVSDIVISRSGAISVAEIKSLNKKAIFIPFESAANSEQIKNLKRIGLKKDRSVVIREGELTKEKVVLTIEKLLAKENGKEKTEYDLKKQIGIIKRYV